MDKTHSIVFYSNNQETLSKISGLDSKRYSIQHLNALDDIHSEKLKNYSLVILEVDNLGELSAYLSLLSHMPVLLILNSQQALSLQKPVSNLIDFIIPPFSLVEFEIRITHLLEAWKTREESILRISDSKKGYDPSREDENVLYVVEVLPKGGYKFIKVSCQIQKITGLPKNIFLGNSLSDLIPYISLKGVEHLRTNFDKCCLSYLPTHVSEFSKHDTIIRKWATILVPIVGKGSNKITHIIGYSMNNSLPDLFHDITSEQEAYFHTLFDSSRDSILVLGLDGYIVDCNKATLDLFKAHSKSNLIHRHVAELSPRYQPNGEESYKLGMKFKDNLGEKLEFDWVHINLEGEEFTCRAQISGLDLKKGKHLLVILRDISEEQRTLTALQQSEERFKKLFKQMTDGFSISEVSKNEKGQFDFKFIEINASYEQILGLSREEVIGKPVKQILPMFSEQQRSTYEEIATKGITAKFEYYSVALDKYFRIIAYRMSDNMIATHFSDISFQKRKTIKLESDKLRLQQDLQRMSVAINKSPVAIVITDPEFKISYINEAFTTITQFSLEESVGHNPSKLLRCSKNTPEAQKQIQDTILQGKTYKSEILSRKKDGTIFWDQTYIIPNMNADGEVESIVIMKEDFSEYKKTEENLRHNQKQLSTIVENSPVAIAFIGSDGRLARGNKQLSNLLGRPMNDMMGESPFNHIFNKNLVKVIHDALRGKPGIYTGKYIKSETEILYIKAEFNPVTPGQSPSEVVVIIEDITEQHSYQKSLKLAKEEAESANKSKSSFLANMSHEIRTPLNAVLGFAELLKKSVKSPVKASYVNSIINSGQTLLQLINDVLDMSKIEANMLSISTHPVNIRQLLNDIEGIFQLQVQKKGLQYITHVDDSIPQLMLIDELRLKQILLNIINNAIKFTSNGYIKITTTGKLNVNRHTADIKIKISDTGKGIENEALEKIFEAFKQQDDSITKEFGGTGLGLTISRRLAELMNGTLMVESKVGKGSSFSLILKDLKIAAHIPIEKEAAMDSVFFEGCTVYIADKNPFNLEHLSELLSLHVDQLVAFSNANNLVNKCQQSYPDLILIDRGLSSAEYPDPAKAIQNLFPDKELPIIALTASVFLDFDKDIRPKGFTGFIRRPINEKELILIMEKNLPIASGHLKGGLEKHIPKGMKGKELKELKKHLKSEVLPALHALTLNQSMRSVNALSNQLTATDKQFNTNIFSSTSNQFEKLSLSFDIGEIRAKASALEKEIMRFLK